MFPNPISRQRTDGVTMRVVARDRTGIAGGSRSDSVRRKRRPGGATQAGKALAAAACGRRARKFSKRRRAQISSPASRCCGDVSRTSLAKFTIMASLATLWRSCAAVIRERSGIRRTDAGRMRWKAQGPISHGSLLREHAPDTIEVPTGNQIRLEYRAKPVRVLAVRLQEIFPWLRHPADRRRPSRGGAALCWGRIFGRCKSPMI